MEPWWDGQLWGPSLSLGKGPAPAGEWFRRSWAHDWARLATWPELSQSGSFPGLLRPGGRGATLIPPGLVAVLMQVLTLAQN